MFCIDLNKQDNYFVIKKFVQQDIASTSEVLTRIKLLFQLIRII